jgi:hypothetical protein
MTFVIQLLQLQAVLAYFQNEFMQPNTKRLVHTQAIHILCYTRKAKKKESPLSLEGHVSTKNFFLGLPIKIFENLGIAVMS